MIPKSRPQGGSIVAKSIMQMERRCYVCGTTYNLHEHHIFFGTANRKKSETYGFKVYLCWYHHNMSDEGVHFNRELDLKLKRDCQSMFEKTHSRDEFMKIIGKNYLED